MVWITLQLFRVCFVDVPGSGAYFMGYEMLLRSLTPEGERSVLRFLFLIWV